MPVVTAHQLVKAFSARRVLDNVSLAIEEHERVGLIGSNGSGKSTLGRILTGLDVPDAGTVAVRRDLDVAYLSQEPVLDDALTAYGAAELGLARWRAATTRYETVGETLHRGEGDQAALLSEQGELGAEIEQLGGWNQGHRVTTMLEHLGITRPEQRVATLSGGERRRVALARLLVSRPGFAVLDEPTNHLDADTAEWLESYLLEEFAGALVLITHDRYFLDSVVTRVFELDRGALNTFEGNYAAYLDLKAERMAHESAVEANRLNILRREKEWLSHKAPARTTKQKARIQRAESLDDTVKSARRSRDVVDLRIATTRGAQRVLELKSVSKRFGERVLFERVDLVLTPGIRCGVIGPNGAGKTTLLNVILGREPPSAGEVIRGPNTRVMYFDQHRAGLDESKSVYDNVFAGSDKVRLGDTDVNIHSYLDRFLFDSAKQRQAVATLSGGERARLALAKMLQGGANLLILDEPTNDLDLVTLAMLEELLVSFDGCALVVTHDRYFLNRVATTILSFERGTEVVQYAGHYDDYRVQRAAMDAQRTQAGLPKIESKQASTPPPARRTRGALTMAEEKELATLGAQIDAAERNVRDLELKLNDPALYATRGADVAALQAQLDRARATVDALMARWEALETKKASGAS